MHGYSCPDMLFVAEHTSSSYYYRKIQQEFRVSNYTVESAMKSLIEFKYEI
jgi:hypothetical protein